MHVLVTGAGGFSGAEVTRALLARGHRVSAAVGSTRGRLGDVDPSRVRLIAGDLAGDIDLPPGVDVIVHAAARSPSTGVTDDDFKRSNVVATRKLVDYAGASGVRKFIFFSSLSVYGDVETAVLDETAPLLRPDAYGRSKRAGEEMLAAAPGSMRSLSIRLPGVLGKGSVRNLLTGMLEKAKRGEEITIYSPDAPFNNAAHVEDLGRFACGLVERDWSGHDIVTVAAEGQMPMRDVVRLIVDGFGGRSEIRVGPPKKPPFLVSSRRARELYGYAPMEIGAMLRRFVSENGGKPR